jgi:predicted AlkP superfamily pyrophosphatase or phosphodiesterase
MTPFANDYAIEFAKLAIENEGLGADDVTDLLTISFSPNDLLGHSYGPYSQEMQDMTLRTDRLLADFFSYLDRRVGVNRTQIVLSSDHGIAPIPEQLRDMSVGGRIDGRQLQELSRRHSRQVLAKRSG